MIRKSDAVISKVLENIISVSYSRQTTHLTLMVSSEKRLSTVGKNVMENTQKIQTIS